MPTLTRRNGEEHLELSKAETRRLLEAMYIVQQIERNMPLCAHAKEFVICAKWVAHKYGDKHLNEAGELLESGSRQRSNDSVPDGPAPEPAEKLDAANS